MIGTKIREMRLEKGMTLNELAEKIEVTASYISQLERNLIDPSISSLRKIAAALGVPIYSFLEEEDTQPVFVAANERKKLELPNSSIVYEFVTPMISNEGFTPKMEIIYYQLNPDSWSSEEILTHKADECIFVLDGIIEVFLQEEKYTLKSGDSIYIKENTQHRIYNPGKEKAIGISTICPPLY